MMRRKGWMRWALLASLAANLLVLGLVAGALLRGPDPAPRRVDLSLGELGRAFAREDRRAIGRDMRARLEGRPEHRLGGRRAARAERAAIAEAIRAEPFDPAALEALLGAQRSRGQAIAEAGHRALSARIAAMDLAARQALAARFAGAERRGD